jgi:hypothetical protein
VRCEHTTQSCPQAVSGTKQDKRRADKKRDMEMLFSYRRSASDPYVKLIEINVVCSDRNAVILSGSSIWILCLDYLKYCSGEEKNSFDYGSSDDVSVAVAISLGVQR